MSGPPAPSFFTPAFLTAAAANFLFFTNLSAYFLLPLHLKRLGATEGQLGLIMGLYSGAAIFCQPLLGAWVDRAGRRRFMLSGAAAASAAALLFAAAPGALGLFPLLRILQGLAYSMFFIANVTLVVDLVPPARRGQAIGIFGISGLTSTAVGPALGELVVKAFGFRVFFVATAVVSSAALVVSILVPEPPGPRRVSSHGLADLVLGAARAPRIPMVLAFAFGLGLGVVFTFFPTYATTLGVERIGLFAVAYSLAALVVRAAGGGLIDTVGRRLIIVPALALQTAAVALLAVLPLLLGPARPSIAPLFLLSGLLAGGAHGFLYPALMALVIDVTPEDRRAQVVGVFSAFMLAGNAAGAMCFGYLAHLLGYGAMFGLLAAVLAAASGLGFRLGR